MSQRNIIQEYTPVTKQSAIVLHNWYLHYGKVFSDMSRVRNNLALIFQNKVSSNITVVQYLEHQISMEENNIKELQNKVV